MQWRTIGINGEDQAADKIIMACRDRLLAKRRDGDDANQPKPGVGWGSIPGTDGRFFGPSGTLERDASATLYETVRGSTMGMLSGSAAAEANSKSFTPGKMVSMRAHQ